jgi:hypothetical protein
MASNIVAPNFVQRWSLVTYPVMMGICEVMIRIERDQQARA